MKKDNQHSGFKTPEGYFDDFGQRMKQRLAASEDDARQAGGFKVPDNYFGDFGDRLKQKLEAGETPVRKLQPRRDFYYAAASVAVLFLLVGVWFMNRPEENLMEDLAHAEIEAYLLQQHQEFSDEELSAYLPEDELQVNEFMGDPLETEQIIDYLDENLEEFEDLNITYDEVQ